MLPVGEKNFVTALDGPDSRGLVISGNFGEFFIQNGTTQISDGLGTTTVPYIETPRTLIQNVKDAQTNTPLIERTSRVALRKENEITCLDAHATFCGLNDGNSTCVMTTYTDDNFLTPEVGESLIFSVNRPSTESSSAYEACHVLSTAETIDIATVTFNKGSSFTFPVSVEVAPYQANTVTDGTGTYVFFINSTQIEKEQVTIVYGYEE